MLQKVQGGQSLQEVPSAAAMSAKKLRPRRDKTGAGPSQIRGVVWWSMLLALPAVTFGDVDWDADIDAELELMERIAAVNEGDLKFVDAVTAAGAHVHDNRVRITPASLDGGWIELIQCHTNLDAVPRAEIVFRPGGIRDLRIESSRNIGRTWVDGYSVQLEDVGDDARLCILAESKALRRMGDGHWRLRNGPYMRRFLDGYYPMQVALDIRYPAERIRLVSQSPAVQPGFDVSTDSGSITVAATFEGRLVTCFDFCEQGTGNCAEFAPSCANEPSVSAETAAQDE